MSTLRRQMSTSSTSKNIIITKIKPNKKKQTNSTAFSPHLCHLFTYSFMNATKTQIQMNNMDIKIE